MINEGIQDIASMMLKATPSKFKQDGKIKLRQDYNYQTCYEVICDYLCLNRKADDSKQAYYNISGFMPK